MAVHVVRVALMQVNGLGAIVNKNNTSINGMLGTSTEHRVIEDTSIQSSVGNPTVKEYLEAEDLLAFTLNYMDQTFIITYST